MSHPIVGILLAAGSGRRFGSDKLSHRLLDGTPMAVAAAVRLLPVCERVVAVLRPGRDQLAAALKAVGCDIVFCPEAEGGMGHSLAAGVSASAEAAGWIVALADMPFIASSSHAAVAAALQAGASLAATQYQGRRGHPVGFARAWQNQLTGLTGDQGGKTLLEQHRQRLTLCPVDDPGVVRDIDYPRDLIDVASGTSPRE
ncbi:nucleotidyltransferase family protein [Pseudogulbenkiania subflava]|uniref:Molybdenum cofactor cytidylyltransferase n=1 Tax=Pseudogulbenkiania subflava DSM 22618 TaxID=1123014 RepID=A0A1Y6C2C0_9NEIS|nr:nucleotidyltransferase family protein [Pseudogulbenkiania subflava]SMF38415.1 molybdenum cofactor cytidylyltransferase [Pseudogulbenkiania subflava DSM 22618]